MIDMFYDRGDTYFPEGQDFWAAGIDLVSIHGNMIEVYGDTKEEANKRRDFVLNAIHHYQEMFKQAGCDVGAIRDVL